MENQPSFLDRFFHLSENGTTVRTEILAGITTFMTMAYILAVNPTIMSAAGMDKGAVLTATALASFIGTLCMAFFANYPFALAPGMGLNAFFAFTVVLQMGYTWEMALAAVFFEGLIFIVLSLTNVREAIFNAIPITLKKAVSAGIGLFIALIGLLNAQIIVANPATKIALFSFKQSAAMGTFHTVGITVLLAMLGIVFTAVLMVKKVRGNILWGILFTWILAILCELTGLYVPNPEMKMFSVIPDLSGGAAAFAPASLSPILGSSTSAASSAWTSWSSCSLSSSSISSTRWARSSASRPRPTCSMNGAACLASKAPSWPTPSPRLSGQSSVRVRRRPLSKALPASAKAAARA